MNAHPPIARFLALLLAVWTPRLHADEAVKPDAAKLRAAITRSLDFLDREADTWMNEQDCNACHHLPLLLWSHREAQQRGFATDQAQFDEFIEWADARSKKANTGLEMLAMLRLALPERPAPALTQLIAGAQQADGSWKPAPQFATMQRRETPEAAGNATRLLLLALAAQEADRPVADAARSKAAAWLEKDRPAKSMETLVVRTLYARRFGPAEEMEARWAEILKSQHPDGGWSFMIGEEQSDPLATGEVLYLLQQVPGAPSAAAIARGQGWLLSHQREDGGWSIDITRISRLDRSGPAKSKSFKDGTGIYTCWGSAWATLGLLQGVPVPESRDGATAR